MSTLARKSLKLYQPSFWIGVGLWLLIWFGLQMYLLDNLRWTYDEGIHLLWAQLLAQGYEPYRQVFVSYPPLYALHLGWLWQIFGSITALQVAMVFLNLAGLLAVGLLAGRLGGLWAALPAMILISLEPEFFRGSRAVLSEVASLSMATVAITLAAHYLWLPSNKRGWRWLILSGLALALSLQLKILAPFVLGLIPLMIIGRHWTTWSALSTREFWQKIIIDGAIWGAVVLIPQVLLALPFHLPSLYRQVIEFRFASRGAYQGEENNLFFMLDFLGRNWLLTGLAVLGVVEIVRNHWRSAWFIPIWLGLTVTFALIQVPLRDKHLPMLLFPLGTMAGLGWVWLWAQVYRLWRFWHWLGVLGYVALLVLSGVYGTSVWHTYTTIQAESQVFLSPDDQILADYMLKFTSPTDCVITDDPTLAAIVSRATPPELAEASSARLRAGYLTSQMLQTTATAADCPVIAPTAKRFYRSAPDFIEWGKQNYLGLWLYDEETEVLLAKPLTTVQPQTPLNADFGGQVHLLGYDWFPPENDQAYLSLYWQPQQPFEQDYTVFVHLRDTAGNTVANADHQPYDGRVPTSRWPVGQPLKETIRLSMPPDLPAGSYTLYVGMYHFDGQTFNRIPLTADASGENAVLIPAGEVP